MSLFPPRFPKLLSLVLSVAIAGALAGCGGGGGGGSPVAELAPDPALPPVAARTTLAPQPPPGSPPSGFTGEVALVVPEEPIVAPEQKVEPTKVEVNNIPTYETYHKPLPVIIEDPRDEDRLPTHSRVRGKHCKTADCDITDIHAAKYRFDLEIRATQAVWTYRFPHRDDRIDGNAIPFSHKIPKHMQGRTVISTFEVGAPAERDDTLAEVKEWVSHRYKCRLMDGCSTSLGKEDGGLGLDDTQATKLLDAFTYTANGIYPVVFTDAGHSGSVWGNPKKLDTLGLHWKGKLSGFRTNGVSSALTGLRFWAHVDFTVDFNDADPHASKWKFDAYDFRNIDGSKIVGHDAYINTDWDRSGTGFSRKRGAPRGLGGWWYGDDNQILAGRIKERNGEGRAGYVVARVYPQTPKFTVHAQIDLTGTQPTRTITDEYGSYIIPAGCEVDHRCVAAWVQLNTRPDNDNIINLWGGVLEEYTDPDTGKKYPPEWVEDGVGGNGDAWGDGVKNLDRWNPVDYGTPEAEYTGKAAGFRHSTGGWFTSDVLLEYKASKMDFTMSGFDGAFAADHTITWTGMEVFSAAGGGDIRDANDENKGYFYSRGQRDTSDTTTLWNHWEVATGRIIAPDTKDIARAYWAAVTTEEPIRRGVIPR